MKAILTKYDSILILLFVGIILGFSSITKHRLSGDEMLTLNTATGLGHSPLINNTWVIYPVPIDKKVFTQNDYWARNTLSSVLQNTALYNGNMVGYNILLYYFIKLTCVDDGLLRGLSALFYIISIVLVYFISKKIFGNTQTAIISAGLFALNPFTLHMGHDLRSYSFVTMTTLISSLLIINMEKQNDVNFKSKLGGGLVLGLIYGISFLGHYFAIYVFIGHFIYSVYSYFILKRNFLLQVFIALFVCTLFFIVWWMHGGKTGYASMEIQDKYILGVTSAQTHTTPQNIIMGTVCFITSVYGYYFQYLGYRNSSFFYLIALPVLAVLIALFFTPGKKEENKGIVFIGVLIISAILVLQLCSIKSGHITSLIMTRFGAFVAPYFMILIGYALYRLWSSKNTLLKLLSVALFYVHIVLCLLCYQIPFGGYWFTYSDANGNVEQVRNEKVPANPYPIMAKTIMDQYALGDTVIYNNYGVAQNTNLYLRDAKTPILQEVNLNQKENYKIVSVSTKAQLQ